MTRHEFSIPVSHIRTADTNTLLRIFDRAQRMLHDPATCYDRERAARVHRLIGKELQKRKVPS